MYILVKLIIGSEVVSYYLRTDSIINSDMSGPVNFDILKSDIKLPTCRLAWVSAYVFVTDILVLSLSYSFIYEVFTL